jgi:hypothetical protein
LVEPFISDAEGTLQGAVSPGSDVVLTLAAGQADNFKVGGNYQIIDGDNRQWVEVGAVDSGANQITIATLSYAFSAGARIGQHPHNWFLFASIYLYVYKFAYSVNGSGDEIGHSGQAGLSFFNSAFSDPNPRGGGNSMYVLWPMVVYDSDALAGFSKDSFLFLRCDLNSTGSEHIITVGDIDGGTSSGSNTSTTLNDTTRSWAVDEHAGKAVAIVGGTGVGQFATISGNTAGTLTIADAWTVTPDATSEYAICDEAWLYLYIDNSAAKAGAIRGV